MPAPHAWCLSQTQTRTQTSTQSPTQTRHPHACQALLGERAGKYGGRWACGSYCFRVNIFLFKKSKDMFYIIRKWHSNNYKCHPPLTSSRAILIVKQACGYTANSLPNILWCVYKNRHRSRSLAITNTNRHSQTKTGKHPSTRSCLLFCMLFGLLFAKRVEPAL